MPIQILFFQELQYNRALSCEEVEGKKKEKHSGTPRILLWGTGGAEESE